MVFEQASGESGEHLFLFAEPQTKLVKEVEARPVEDLTGAQLIFGAEEDGRGKDMLKALDHAAVIAAILGKPEEIQQLGDAAEVHGSALLP